MGITFKENCPDIRNSKVIDVINELKEFECQVDVFDPWANKAEVKHEYGIDIITDIAEVYQTTTTPWSSPFPMIIPCSRSQQTEKGRYRAL